MLRIIVADDEPDVRLVLRLQLQAAGFDVVGEARNGREALDLCTTLAPEAVVLDLLMPVMSGIDAAQVLRQQLPDIGVVAYSAVAGETVRDLMGRLGVAVVLKTGRIGPLVTALLESVGAG